MHALDAVYKDQQKELSGWITKVNEIKNELRNTTMEFYLANQERPILKRKLTDCRQEMDTLLQDPHIWKRVEKMNKGTWPYDLLQQAQEMEYQSMTHNTLL